MIAVTVTTHDIDFNVPKRIVRHVVSFDFENWLKQIGVRWNWPAICFVLIQKYKTNNKMNVKGCHLWNMCFFAALSYANNKRDSIKWKSFVSVQWTSGEGDTQNFQRLLLWRAIFICIAPQCHFISVALWMERRMKRMSVEF